MVGKFITTISQNIDGKYYAFIMVDDSEAIPSLSTDGKAVGIDLGITHFCITSNGSKFDNSRHVLGKSAIITCPTSRAILPTAVLIPAQISGSKLGTRGRRSIEIFN